MGQSYFIWKGIDCRSMGVRLSGPVSIVRPEERVKHVEIPGRSGDLTELEGEQIYNSYIQTAGILVHGGRHVRDIYNWLKGSGYVTFSGEPDRRQKARVIGAITLDKHSYNMDWWEGEVQFYCQPLKEKLQSDKVTITSSGSIVMNAGDVIARPFITLIASNSTVVITIGGNTLTITGLTVTGIYDVDCETMEVWDYAPNLRTRYSTGDFPLLNPGSNEVTGSGWSSLVIEKRERFL